jgi:hypothetical protein
MMFSRFKLGGYGLVLASTLAFGGTAVAAPSLQFIDGRTNVQLSGDLLGALTAYGVTPGNVLPGRLYPSESGARVVFPIPTGELDADGPKLEIFHSGGLTLTAGDTRVALTSFIIENLDGNLQLTGIVKANDTIVGRIPLFDLELTQAPGLEPTSGGIVSLLTIGAVQMTLTADAADALNAAFGLDNVFTQGFPIGRARVTARLRDRDG